MGHPVYVHQCKVELGTWENNLFFHVFIDCRENCPQNFQGDTFWRTLWTVYSVGTAFVVLVCIVSLAVPVRHSQLRPCTLRKCYLGSITVYKTRFTNKESVTDSKRGWGQPSPISSDFFAGNALCPYKRHIVRMCNCDKVRRDWHIVFRSPPFQNFFGIRHCKESSDFLAIFSSCRSTRGHKSSYKLLRHHVLYYAVCSL